MLETREFELQDNEGNIYYPHTDAEVVKYNDSTVKSEIDRIKNDIDNFQSSGNSAPVKLTSYAYDVSIETEGQTKIEIPNEYFDKENDTLEVYLNGIAVPNSFYTVTNPVETDGVRTKGYITLTEGRSSGSYVRFVILKNVFVGKEGAVSGTILRSGSVPQDRVVGLSDIKNMIDQISNPNLFINGDFRNPINQRGKTEYIRVNDYTVDRWKQWNDTFDTKVMDGFIRLEGSYIALGQYIENVSSIFKKGTKFTFSARVKGAKKGKIKLSYYDHIAGRYIGNVGSADIDTNWKTISYTSEVTVDYVNWKTFFCIEAAENCELLDIEWIKLELGNKATPFYARLYGEELALCQRYYEVGNNTFNGIVANSSECKGILPFKATKRITPTITLQKDSLSAKNCIVVNGNWVGNVGVSYIDTEGSITVTSSNSFSGLESKYWTCVWIADAEIY